VPGRVLITGISGFTGPYVRAALESRGHQVVGLADHARGPADRVVDLLDADAVRRFVEAESFNYVVHLAAVSFVAHETAADYYRVNVLGTLNLLEALAAAPGKLKKVVLASSANVYGRPLRNPVDESAAPAPMNHYGVSKLAMELMAGTWFDRLPILITRPFNYSGVGQSPKFVLPKLVGHFRDRAETIELGDTAVVREFMDVRDVADVYAALLESAAVSQAVNLCAGQGYRLDEILEKLGALTGVAAPRIKRAPGLVRSNEIPHLVGSPARLRSLLPSAAFRPLEETLRWMLAG
jgi:GDP-6-deoxy-D-talose 4-dehydrogenase